LIAALDIFGLGGEALGMRLCSVLGALVGAFFVSWATSARADAIDDLQPGSWYEIPSSKLRDACPANSASYDWHFHCQNVVRAWSGAALDTTRGRLIVWGGGHADYKGNEVYAFDMTTLVWSRLWGPTPDAQIPSGGTHEQYDDGNPGSRHTYSGLAYVPPPTDALVSFGGSLWQSGSYAAGVWSFSFATTAWTRKADGPGEQGFGDPVVFDPQTGKVFRRANSRMFEYDPATDQHSDRADSNGGFWASNVSAALDPDARLMVIVGDERVDLYHLDTDTYEQGVNVTGASVKDLFAGIAPGIDFDAVQKKFVLWGGGGDVYTFDPVAKSFGLHAVVGTKPGAVTTSGGVFGRFRYVPSRNVFVLLNDVDENVFVLRMAPGTGTPPPVVDGGTAGGGGSGGTGNVGGAGSSAGAGNAAGAAAKGGDDSGCGCSLPGRGRATGSFALVGALVAAAARRRRRQRSG